MMLMKLIAVFALPLAGSGPVGVDGLALPSSSWPRPPSSDDVMATLASVAETASAACKVVAEVSTDAAAVVMERVPPAMSDLASSVDVSAAVNKIKAVAPSIELPTREAVADKVAAAMELVSPAVSKLGQMASSVEIPTRDAIEAFGSQVTTAFKESVSPAVTKLGQLASSVEMPTYETIEALSSQAAAAFTERVSPAVSHLGELVASSVELPTRESVQAFGTSVAEKVAELVTPSISQLSELVVSQVPSVQIPTLESVATVSFSVLDNAMELIKPSIAQLSELVASPALTVHVPTLESVKTATSSAVASAVELVSPSIAQLSELVASPAIAVQVPSIESVKTATSSVVSNVTELIKPSIAQLSELVASPAIAVQVPTLESVKAVGSDVLANVVELIKPSISQLSELVASPALAVQVPTLESVKAVGSDVVANVLELIKPSISQLSELVASPAITVPASSAFGVDDSDVVPPTVTRLEPLIFASPASNATSVSSAFSPSNETLAFSGADIAGAVLELVSGTFPRLSPLIEAISSPKSMDDATPAWNELIQHVITTVAQSPALSEPLSNANGTTMNSFAKNSQKGFVYLDFGSAFSNLKESFEAGFESITETVMPLVPPSVAELDFTSSISNVKEYVQLQITKSQQLLSASASFDVNSAMYSVKDVVQNKISSWEPPAWSFDDVYCCSMDIATRVGNMSAADWRTKLDETKNSIPVESIKEWADRTKEQGLSMAMSARRWLEEQLDA